MSRPEQRRLRILVIAPSRHPIAEPHAGGLEAAVWDRVRSLRAAGHAVTLVAAHGSDFLDETPMELRLPSVAWEGTATSDEAYPAGYVDAVALVLHRLTMRLVQRPDEFDLVDNHSLHPLPIASAREHGIPMLTTLHTPPLPELVDAALVAGPAHEFLAVSEYTAAQWRAHGVEARVLANVVDADAWPLGRGGPDLVWFGRIVPEKGPHLAIDAARLLGRDIVVAGRVGDVGYFEQEVAPRLGPGVRHVGGMQRAALARLVGRSGAALVTPRWDEPFGLVLAEALCTGTPVACFARGGVAEVVDGLPGTRLLPADDVEALARAADELLATGLAERRRIRAHAVRRFASSERMPVLDELLRTHAGRASFVDVAAAS
ncbi:MULTISPECIES: glycosyltransferase [unclassified Agrococcus]|uniref:glycosyltransferase n=1 Tax=unclassified Agrococcus TaxID=2615065 RepID=UPI00360B4C6F